MNNLGTLNRFYSSFFFCNSLATSLEENFTVILDLLDFIIAVLIIKDIVKLFYGKLWRERAIS